MALPRTQFRVQPLGPFSLAAAARFWGGFTPAAHGGLDPEGHLHMAFPLEGTWTTVGVCLRESRDNAVVGEVYGDFSDVARVERQTARILSLDIDGSRFPLIAQRDPIAGELQRRFPGLRPVCFYSAYEAATWAIISQRIAMRQAAAIKARIAESLGEVVEIHGEPMRAFPSPEGLLSLLELAGLFGRKLEYLHAMAHAAQAGALDAAYLRSLPEDVAVSRLQSLPGIGPFGAQLILLRGAGHPDYLTLLEPTLRKAVTQAYQLDHAATDDDLRRIADNWRPFRMWQTFLFRQHG